MPVLPLSAPPPIDGGEIPVRSSEDVLALLPIEVRKIAAAPVRDALAEALTAILQEYGRRSSQGAGLGDILRATGRHLAGLAADHDVFPQIGESDEAIRARILKLDELVTPNDIIEVANAILAPFTDKRVRYFESEVDQWFVHDGTTDAWDSFVFDDTAAASPRYPDRLYQDDIFENIGDAIQSREPAGAWVFADQLGRHFLLRLPVLDDVDAMDPFIFDGAIDVGAPGGNEELFVGDGSDTAGSESDGSLGAFIFETQALSDDLYAAIVSIVELMKGQGMRWSAWVDPLLT